MIIRPSTQQSVPMYIQNSNEIRSSDHSPPQYPPTLTRPVPTSSIPNKLRVKTHFHYFPSPIFLNQNANHRIQTSPIQPKPMEKIMDQSK